MDDASPPARPAPLGQLAPPGHPASPAHPASPGHPASPAHPAPLGQPASPAQPVPPAQPAHPAPSARPAPPGHPASSGQPAPPGRSVLPGRRSVVRGLLAPGAVLAAAAAGTALVASVDPNEPGHYPACPFLFLTGYYCPGCGATRMVHALAHGRLGEAAGLNPLLLAVLPVAAYLYARWAVAAARGRPLRTALFRPPVVYGFLGLLIVYWVVRNLPFAQALAP